MASRAALYWRSFKNQIASSRKNPSTINPRPVKVKGEYTPIYVALGLILLSVTFGVHTAKNQLAYNPGVAVSKKKRESLPEVDEPDVVVDEADRFINKSIFRRAAHVQDFDSVRAGITDPIPPVQLDRPRKVESLKSVGVETQSVGH